MLRAQQDSSHRFALTAAQAEAVTPYGDAMIANLRYLALVWVVGCGGEPSPVEKCDDLLDVLCDRGVQCLGGTHAECVQALQSALPCGSAKAVSASYDRCIDQLQGASCASLFPPDPQSGQPALRLPADCMSVVLTRTAGVPTATFSMPRPNPTVAQ